MRLRDLYEQYKDRVEFMVVYVREAHGTDKWWLGASRTLTALHTFSGNPAKLDIEDPATMDGRRTVAKRCHQDLFDGAVPMYVDDMDNSVASLYAGRPTRIYFLDREGKVIYNPGIGPFAFNPEHLGPVIDEYLASQS